MDRPRSEALFREARARMPGGVNSPVRAFRGVGGTPVFVRRAFGPFFEDEDGHRYIDYVGSWGPMILGHAHPVVIDAICRTAADGTSFGAPTALENEMADQVMRMVPSIELIRMVSSGTEATLSAIRLARGFTGRPKLLKFAGCYHGHSDSLLVSAGSGVATLGLPDSPGVLPELAQNTLTVEFNDIEAVEAVFAAVGGALAAVIVEPVAGNMGCVPPRPGFLERLRALCDQHGAVLIFDEVMTGFRCALGGAQAVYGVRPDLTTLGKILGGGLPAAAYGGRRDIMSQVAPSGPVYQAGTLSGNPLAMAAGLATLRILEETPSIHAQIVERTEGLVDGLIAAAEDAGIPLVGAQVGAMAGVFFGGDPVHSYADAKRTDTGMFRRWFHAMLDRGVYLPPSAFEAFFVGAGHTDEVVEATLVAAREAFEEVSVLSDGEDG